MKPTRTLTLIIVLALALLAAPLAAEAQPAKVYFGAMELTLAAGGSFSHNTVGENVERVDGFQLLPHFGVFLTDEHGLGWVRGNFELVAEPTLVYLTSTSESATAVGLSALGRWVFGAGWVVRPYIEFGLGILAGQLDFRQTNCDVNLIIEGGPGLSWFVSDRVAITAGYRFQHISDASRCDQNLGINSSLFMLGLSYFFP
jgi:lipid A 3-O-deacylase